ncbi:MAG: hypothetical protein JRE19_05425 [Deltaproteobacteria bacterium]|nr:hypothetical protein [Deltaproteobacteria bacterium]
MPKKVVQVAAIMALSLVGLLDLGCGHESAATQQVRSVSGCGRTLTYMSKCNAAAGGGQTCSWKPVRDESNKLN